MDTNPNLMSSNLNDNQNSVPESSYQQFLRETTLSDEPKNPFALEMFGMNPADIEVDNTFGLTPYDQRSHEVALDNFELWKGKREIPNEARLPMDLTHKLYVDFRKRPLYSILVKGLPEQERPLSLFDLQEIRWLKTSLERKEGDLAKKRKELALLESRPLSFEVLADRVKSKQDSPAQIARLFFRYAKARTKLQFWPLWASPEVKKEIRRELGRRLVYKLSRGKTYEWPVFREVLSHQWTAVAGFNFHRETVRELGWDSMKDFWEKRGIAGSFVGYVMLNVFAATAFARPKSGRNMPILSAPYEHVEWETFRSQEEQGHPQQILPKTTRVEVTAKDVLVDLHPTWSSHQDQSYQAYWGDPTATEFNQVILSLQPREARAPFALAVVKSQNLDEHLDELPRKLASQEWLDRSREFVQAANTLNLDLRSHSVVSLAQRTYRFHQIQATPTVVPHVDWLDTWFISPAPIEEVSEANLEELEAKLEASDVNLAPLLSAESDEMTDLSLLSMGFANQRDMGRYRYPDMDADQIRFLWLRHFLFRIRNARRSIRNRLGVSALTPRPTVAPPSTLQTPSAKSFTRTLIQWLSLFGNNFDMAYNKIPLMNLDVLHTFQLENLEERILDDNDTQERTDEDKELIHEEETTDLVEKVTTDLVEEDLSLTSEPGSEEFMTSLIYEVDKLEDLMGSELYLDMKKFLFKFEHQELTWETGRKMTQHIKERFDEEQEKKLAAIARRRELIRLGLNPDVDLLPEEQEAIAREEEEARLRAEEEALAKTETKEQTAARLKAKKEQREAEEQAKAEEQARIQAEEEAKKAEEEANMTPEQLQQREEERAQKEQEEAERAEEERQKEIERLRKIEWEKALQKMYEYVRTREHRAQLHQTIRNHFDQVDWRQLDRALKLAKPGSPIPRLFRRPWDTEIPESQKHVKSVRLDRLTWLDPDFQEKSLIEQQAIIATDIDQLDDEFRIKMKKGVQEWHDEDSELTAEQLAAEMKASLQAELKKQEELRQKELTPEKKAELKKVEAQQKQAEKEALKKLDKAGRKAAKEAAKKAAREAEEKKLEAEQVIERKISLEALRRVRQKQWKQWYANYVLGVGAKSEGQSNIDLGEKLETDLALFEDTELNELTSFINLEAPSQITPELSENNKLKPVAKNPLGVEFYGIGPKPDPSQKQYQEEEDINQNADETEEDAEETKEDAEDLENKGTADVKKPGTPDSKKKGKVKPEPYMLRTTNPTIKTQFPQALTLNPVYVRHSAWSQRRLDELDSMRETSRVPRILNRPFPRLKKLRAPLNISVIDPFKNHTSTIKFIDDYDFFVQRHVVHNPPSWFVRNLSKGFYKLDHFLQTNKIVRPIARILEFDHVGRSMIARLVGGTLGTDEHQRFLPYIKALELVVLSPYISMEEKAEWHRANQLELIKEANETTSVQHAMELQKKFQVRNKRYWELLDIIAPRRQLPPVNEVMRAFMSQRSESLMRPVRSMRMLGIDVKHYFAGIKSKSPRFPGFPSWYDTSWPNIKIRNQFFDRGSGFALHHAGYEAMLRRSDPLLRRREPRVRREDPLLSIEDPRLRREEPTSFSISIVKRDESTLLSIVRSALISSGQEKLKNQARRLEKLEKLEKLRVLDAQSKSKQLEIEFQDNIYDELAEILGMIEEDQIWSSLSDKIHLKLRQVLALILQIDPSYQFILEDSGFSVEMEPGSHTIIPSPLEKFRMQLKSLRQKIVARKVDKIRAELFSIDTELNKPVTILDVETILEHERLRTRASSLRKNLEEVEAAIEKAKKNDEFWASLNTGLDEEQKEKFYSDLLNELPLAARTEFRKIWNDSDLETIDPKREDAPEQVLQRYSKIWAQIPDKLKLGLFQVYRVRPRLVMKKSVKDETLNKVSSTLDLLYQKCHRVVYEGDALLGAVNLTHTEEIEASLKSRSLFEKYNAFPIIAKHFVQEDHGRISSKDEIESTLSLPRESVNKPEKLSFLDSLESLESALSSPHERVNKPEKLSFSDSLRRQGEKNKLQRLIKTIKPGVESIDFSNQFSTTTEGGNWTIPEVLDKKVEWNKASFPTVYDLVDTNSIIDTDHLTNPETDIPYVLSPVSKVVRGAAVRKKSNLRISGLESRRQFSLKLVKQQQALNEIKRVLTRLERLQWTCLDTLERLSTSQIAKPKQTQAKNMSSSETNKLIEIEENREMLPHHRSIHLPVPNPLNNPNWHPGKYFAYNDGVRRPDLKDDEMTIPRSREDEQRAQALAMQQAQSRRKDQKDQKDQKDKDRFENVLEVYEGLTPLIDALRARIQTLSAELLSAKPDKPAKTKQDLIKAITSCLEQSTPPSSLDSLDAVIIDDLLDKLPLFPWSIREDIFLILKAEQASRKNDTVRNLKKDLNDARQEIYYKAKESTGEWVTKSQFFPQSEVSQEDAGQVSSLHSSESFPINNQEDIDLEQRSDDKDWIDLTNYDLSIEELASYLELPNPAEMTPEEMQELMDDYLLSSSSVVPALQQKMTLSTELADDLTRPEIAVSDIDLRAEVLHQPESLRVHKQDLKRHWQEENLELEALEESLKFIEASNEDALDSYPEPKTHPRSEQTEVEVMESQYRGAKRKLDQISARQLSFRNLGQEKQIFIEFSWLLKKQAEKVDNLKERLELAKKHLDDNNTADNNKSVQLRDEQFWQELLALWETMPLPLMERIHLRWVQRQKEDHSMQKLLEGLFGQEGALNLHEARLYRLMRRQLDATDWSAKVIRPLRFNDILHPTLYARAGQIFSRRNTLPLYTRKSLKSYRGNKFNVRNPNSNVVRKLFKKAKVKQMRRATKPWITTEKRMGPWVHVRLNQDATVFESFFESHFRVDPNQFQLEQEGLVQPDKKQALLGSPIFLQSFEAFERWVKEHPGVSVSGSKRGPYSWTDLSKLDQRINQISRHRSQKARAKLAARKNKIDFKADPNLSTQGYLRASTAREMKERLLEYQNMKNVYEYFYRMWKQQKTSRENDQLILNLAKLKLEKMDKIDDLELTWQVPLDPYGSNLDTRQIRNWGERRLQEAYETGLGTSSQTRMMRPIIFEGDDDAEDEIFKFVSSGVPAEDQSPFVQPKNLADKFRDMRTKLARRKFPAWVPQRVVEELLLPQNVRQIKASTEWNYPGYWELGFQELLSRFNPPVVEDEEKEEGRDEEKEKDDQKDEQKEEEEDEDEDEDEDEEKDEEEQQDEDNPIVGTSIFEIFKLPISDRLGSLDEPLEGIWKLATPFSVREDQPDVYILNRDHWNIDEADVERDIETSSNLSELMFQQNQNALQTILEEPEAIRSEETEDISSKEVEDITSTNLQDTEPIRTQQSSDAGQDFKEEELTEQQKQFEEAELKLRALYMSEVMYRSSIILEHMLQAEIKDLKKQWWVLQTSALPGVSVKIKKKLKRQLTSAMALLRVERAMVSEMIPSSDQAELPLASSFAVSLLNSSAPRQAFHANFHRSSLLQASARCFPSIVEDPTVFWINEPSDLWSNRRWQTRLQWRQSRDSLHLNPYVLKLPERSNNVPESSTTLWWPQLSKFQKMSDSDVDSWQEMALSQDPIQIKLERRLPTRNVSRNLRRVHQKITRLMHTINTAQTWRTQVIDSHITKYDDDIVSHWRPQPRVHQFGSNPYARQRLNNASLLSEGWEDAISSQTFSHLNFLPNEIKYYDHYRDGWNDAMENQQYDLMQKWRKMMLDEIEGLKIRYYYRTTMHVMAVRPAQRFAASVRWWKFSRDRVKGPSDVSWSERMYGKTTWQVTSKLVHPWFIMFRLWAFLLHLHLLNFVLIPLMKKVVYAYAVQRKWIRNAVWSITYLDRKGENNRRSLNDIVALNPYLEQELLMLIHTLSFQGIQPTKRVWTWSEFEKGHKFVWPWESVLFRYPIAYHAGVLLVGPPGTGKTLLGQALAGSANVRFLGMTSSEFLFKGIKAGPTNIHHLFVYARNNAPCVLFIDEIDTLTTVRTGRALQQNILPTTVGTYRDLRFARWRPGLARRRKKAAGDFWRLKNPFWSPEPVTEQTYFEHSFNVEIDHLHGTDIGQRRAKATSAGWENRDASALTIQMLTEIDGCYKKSKVFLMGSTNRISRIDAAITRPGRIDRIIHLSRPDSEQRLEMLKHYTKGQEILFPMRGFNFHQVHAMTVGMTAADISTLVNESKVYSVLQQVKLERKLGRILGSLFPHAHTTVSIERGVDVVTSVLSSDLRYQASERTLSLYQPFLWSSMAYYRAARAVVINYLPPFYFVGATLFTQRPRGRKNVPIYDKVDGESHFERFDANLCKAAVLAHLSGMASKFLLMQRRSFDATGLAWLDLHHRWELDLATAYAYKIVDQWGLVDPYVSVSRVMLGSKQNVNMAMEKRSYRVRKFKLYSPRLQKASRLGRKFKLLESTVFQQNYSFELAEGEEAYIADMPIWWDSYFYCGSNKRTEDNMQTRFVPVWKKGTRRRYTNWEWITPFRYQSGYRLRTWNQQSLYLDPRDSQMTHVMKTGFEVVWRLLEDHRALLDQCVIIMLIKKKLRAKDLARFMVPFKVVREDYLKDAILNPELEVEPLRRHSQYVPRRLERSWRLESNRFVASRQQRIIMPTRTPVWVAPISKALPPRSLNPYTIPTYLDRMSSQLQSINQDLDQVIALLKLDDTTVNTMSVLDTGTLKTLERRLGVTLGLPEPSRCRSTNENPPVPFLFEVLQPLDPLTTPAKQLEHIAVQVAYSMAFIPLIETVQDWILRWDRQEMHVFDLFWMLIPLDSQWNLTSNKELPTGMTVHQFLCMEPARYSWLLMSKPDDILWGQDVPHERIQAWTQFCENLKVNMDNRLAVRTLTLGSDFLNDLVQNEFPAVTFEKTESLTQETALQILDLADGWLQTSRRHQAILHALSNLEEAGQLRDTLQRIAVTEKEFVENIPTLRTHMCRHVRHVVKQYSLAVNTGRKICAYAANRFYYLEDARQLPLENQ